MTTTTNTPPTALASTWDLVAGPYTDNVAPHFDTFAGAALDMAADVGVDVDGKDIVDVACGPGTLSLQAARRGARVRALDFSPAMIERLTARAAAEGATIDAVVGDGQSLPWPDASADAAFSMFGLMFFPDRDKGFRELARVLRPGGVAVVSSWVEVKEAPILHDALVTLNTAMKRPAPAPPRPGLSLTDDYTREMGGAGFSDVVVEQRSALVPFASPTALLQWMSSSMAPIVLLRQSMAAAAWDEIFLRWKVELMTLHGAMPVELPLIALLGRGRRP